MGGGVGARACPLRSSFWTAPLIPSKSVYASTIYYAVYIMCFAFSDNLWHVLDLIPAAFHGSKTGKSILYGKVLKVN